MFPRTAISSGIPLWQWTERGDFRTPRWKQRRIIVIVTVLGALPRRPSGCCMLACAAGKLRRDRAGLWRWGPGGLNALYRLLCTPWPFGWCEERERTNEDALLIRWRFYRRRRERETMVLGAALIPAATPCAAPLVNLSVPASGRGQLNPLSGFTGGAAVVSSSASSLLSQRGYIRSSVPRKGRVHWARLLPRASGWIRPHRRLMASLDVLPLSPSLLT